MSDSTVKPEDVIILTVPEAMSNERKAAYLDWFRGVLQGTSLEGCRVVLLDRGADVKLFRGAMNS